MLKKVTDLTDGALLVWESEIFYMKKPADCSAGYFLSGGEEEIRTLGTLLTYTISNRAPSTNSDTSPCREDLLFIGRTFGFGKQKIAIFAKKFFL